ncbi:MAG: hypothetical protein JOZ41_19290 [Chloroflexi bacterium]|nr:hypothetical protein [Chloroflexota bacterium]
MQDDTHTPEALQTLPWEQQVWAPVVGFVQAAALGQHAPLTLTCPVGQHRPLEHV